MKSGFELKVKDGGLVPVSERERVAKGEGKKLKNDSNLLLYLKPILGG